MDFRRLRKHSFKRQALSTLPPPRHRFVSWRGSRTRKKNLLTKIERLRYLVTGWTIRSWNPGRDDGFFFSPKRPVRLWGSPNILWAQWAPRFFPRYSARAFSWPLTVHISAELSTSASVTCPPPRRCLHSAESVSYSKKNRCWPVRRWINPLRLFQLKCTILI